jgi:hypothetical protein
MVFYRSVLNSSTHGAFVRQLDSLCPEPVRQPTDLKLLIVPALFYKERPEFGGDGRALAAIAEHCGFTVALAPLHSRGSIKENAQLIWQTIEQEESANLWLASLSKGSSEVRLALQSHPQHPALAKVRGWINVSGLVRGTPLAERYRLGMKAFFLLAGVDSRTADELHPRHFYWQTPFYPPPHLHVINLIGVPLRHHIRQRNMLWRYTRLARFGPNDGMAPLHDLLVEPGLLYPVWGADHFFQTPQVDSLLHKLFTYIRTFPTP